MLLPHILPKILGQTLTPGPCSAPSQSSSAHFEKEKTAKENPAAWFSYHRKIKNAKHLPEHISFFAQGLPKNLRAFPQLSRPMLATRIFPSRHGWCPEPGAEERAGEVPARQTRPRLSCAHLPSFAGLQGMWRRLWVVSRLLRKKPCSPPEQEMHGSPSTLAVRHPGPLQREIPILYHGSCPLWLSCLSRAGP